MSRGRHGHRRVGASNQSVRVGVNLLFLAVGVRSGTATVAWSTLERLRERTDIDLVIYAQDGWTNGPYPEVVACPRFRGMFHRIAWEQLMLPRRAAADGIDVLWSPGYVSPLWGRFGRVVTIHDMYYARVPEALPFVRRLYYRFFTRASVARCDAVIAVSETTRDDLFELVPRSKGRTTVVHSAARGSLTGTVADTVEVGHRYFLVVASVTKNKNIEGVIAAAAELRRRGIDCPVHVVGADPYGLLRAAIEVADASDAVKVQGEVTDAELAGWYAGAVAVVHASRYEGFGLPVLEAQALGVPVISSRGGALPEVAGDGARYFDYDRPEDLADAMAEVLSDAELRSRLVRAGHANVARFSWDGAADKMAEVLISVANAR